MALRLGHGRTSLVRTSFLTLGVVEERGMPERACAKGMVSLFID